MVECNKCHASFSLTDSLCGKCEMAGLEIHYFRCPECGHRYPTFVADDEMREMVEARKKINEEFILARNKKFREKTIKSYMKEADKIKKRQTILLEKLKITAEDLLEKEGVVGHG